MNVSLVVPLAHARPFAGRLEAFFRARLKQLRHLWPRLSGVEPLGKLMVMGPLAYRVRPPRHDGVLLVGDAAGFYDPFTGEGLYTALRSAEMLVETADPALGAGDVRARDSSPTRRNAARRSAPRSARPGRSRSCWPGAGARTWPLAFAAAAGPPRPPHGCHRGLRSPGRAAPPRGAARRTLSRPSSRPPLPGGEGGRWRRLPGNSGGAEAGPDQVGSARKIVPARRLRPSRHRVRTATVSRALTLNARGWPRPAHVHGHLSNPGLAPPLNSAEMAPGRCPQGVEASGRPRRYADGQPRSRGPESSRARYAGGRIGYASGPWIRSPDRPSLLPRSGGTVR